MTIIQRITGRINPLQVKVIKVFLLKVVAEGSKNTETNKIGMKELKSLTGSQSEFDAESFFMPIAKLMFKIKQIDDAGQTYLSLTPLMSEIRIEKGCVSYTISPSVKKMLQNKDNRAIIERWFESTHNLLTIRMLNFISPYIKETATENRTPFLKIDELQLMLGLEGRYKNFYEFNRSVLKKCINEIHREAKIRVIVVYQKQSNKISAIQFIIMPLAAYASYMVKSSLKTNDKKLKEST